MVVAPAVGEDEVGRGPDFSASNAALRSGNSAGKNPSRKPRFVTSASPRL